MSKVKYSEIEKKRPGGRHVWGVLQMEGRKQKFQTVGCIPSAGFGHSEALSQETSDGVRRTPRSVS